MKEAEGLRRLEAASLQDLSSEWRGKVYRRIESAEAAHKREEDEQKERRRWGWKLAGLLLEAGLPFSPSLTGSLEGASLRCCRGKRASTLSQHISCRRPFRRRLFHSGLVPWPKNTEAVLAMGGL